MKTLYWGLHVFHIIWVVVLIGAPILSFKYQIFTTISTIAISTTWICQLVFVGCPIVIVQQLIQRKYLGEPDTPILSLTGWLFEKFIGVQLSPMGVTVVVFSVLIINTCIIIFKDKGV